MALPDEFSRLRGPFALHLVMLAMLIVGAAFKDEVGWLLRVAGAGFAFLACLVVSLGGLAIDIWQLPAWVTAYPLVMAGLLAFYGWLLYHDRSSYTFAAGIVALWLFTAGWRSYLMLRQLVAGLDPMALSLAVFVVAVLISLGKSGTLVRWLVARGWLEAAEGNGVRSSGPPPTPMPGQPSP
jgi:hypothetical protein